MIIRSKFDTNSIQKKKLTIAISKSNLFKGNFKIHKISEQKNKNSNLKSFSTKNQQQIKTQDKIENKDYLTLNKENNQRKLSINIHKRQQVAEQKMQAGRVFRLLKGSQKQTNSNFLPIIQTISQVKQQKKMKADNNKKNLINNRLVISHSLNSSTNKGQNMRLSQYEMSIQQNDRQRTNYKGRNSKIIKKNYTQQQVKLIQNISQFNFNYNQISQSRYTDFKKTANLFIEQNIINIRINPTQNKTQKTQSINVQTQTIQQQKQFYQYLRYKRRKQQFQSQLQSAFQQLNQIKKDRSTYNLRLSKLLNNNAQPQNQREKRVFSLRKQILTNQQTVQHLIYEKYNSLEKYIKEFEALQEYINTDNHKFIQSISKYKQNLLQGINIQDAQKFSKSYQKLQKIIKNNARDNLKKIYIQLEKGKHFKEDQTELITAFKEYKNSFQELKGLLKNCFSHIKKIPQLCYGLLGGQLPDLKPGTKLKNSNNQFQMPKCIDCFNSEWKLHMIIEKNQLMEPIFKVTQQLFK